MKEFYLWITFFNYQDINKFIEFFIIKFNYKFLLDQIRSTRIIFIYN